jgi:hypothetical protein
MMTASTVVITVIDPVSVDEVGVAALSHTTAEKMTTWGKIDVAKETMDESVYGHGRQMNPRVETEAEAEAQISASAMQTVANGGEAEALEALMESALATAHRPLRDPHRPSHLAHQINQADQVTWKSVPPV